MSLWRVMSNLERLQRIAPMIVSMFDPAELDHIKVERDKSDRRLVIRLYNMEGVEYGRITVERLI